MTLFPGLCNPAAIAFAAAGQAIPGEAWKPVHGYERLYAVSTHGRVARTTDHQGRSIFRLVSTTIGWSGYPQCQLWKENKHHGFLVHRLVASAFIEKPSSECNEVNHKDGKKTNCVVTNLEWVTRSQNNQHALDTGLRKPNCVVGEKHHFAKLTATDVVRIKEKLATHTDDELAKEFNVRRGTIGHIRKGRTWKSLVGGPMRRALAEASERAG